MNCKLIRGGFSFCGVDIAELGLSYAPEKEDTYVYRPADVNVHEETFDGHDGGYFYGVSKQPKEFALRCYFEEETIDRGVMERIYNLFRTGRSGKLVFSRRPWCYYYATVTSLPHPELNNYMNGLITITMKAHYPYARGDSMFYDPFSDEEEKENDIVLSSTALVENENMIPDVSFSNLTSATTFILHNPGTEYAPLSIIAAGDTGLGVTIRNETTNQNCRLIAMEKATTSDLDKAVYVDGMNGKTSLIGMNDGSSSLAFYYHDSGFIKLAPAYPALREIYVSNVEDDVCTLVNTIYQDVTGWFIFIAGQWVEILEQQDENTLKLAEQVSSFDQQRTMITRMNKISIIPDDTMELTHISFSYKPTYA